MFSIYNHNYAGPKVTNLSEFQNVSNIDADTQRWFDVRLSGNKIGYAMTSYSQSSLGYIFKDYSLLRIPMAGVLREVLLDFYAVVDLEFSIKSFTFGLASGDYSTDIFGGVKNGYLEMEIRNSDGSPSKMAFPVGGGLYLPGMVPFVMASKGFPQGQFVVRSLDPFALAVSNMAIETYPRESITVDGKKYDAYRLEVTVSGVSSTMWVLDNGTVVKEQEAAGMEMTLTTKEQALNIPDFNPEWDILKSLAVEVDRELASPREATYMKINLLGIEPAGFHLYDDFQKVLPSVPPTVEISTEQCIYKIEHSGSPSLEKYLKAETFIQSDDPNIIRQSQKIIGNIDDDSLKVIALVDWVYKNVEKDYAISLPSAVDVLKVRRGDCNEHTALFTALARSAGIPTKVCLGVVYNEGMFYYHAWPAVYINECWRAVDPTIGQHVADATHILLLEGTLDAQASLMRVVGKLKVKVLDYKTSMETALNQ